MFYYQIPGWKIAYKVMRFAKDMTAYQWLGYNSLMDTQDFLYGMACQTQLWSAPMGERVA